LGHDESVLKTMTLIQVIEALLFSAQKHLTTNELRDDLKRSGDNDELVPNEFGRVKEAEVAATLGQLKTDYTLTPRGFQLVEKAGGWQLLFNGKDLDGWQCNNGKPIATPVEDGCLVPFNAGGDRAQRSGRSRSR